MNKIIIEGNCGLILIKLLVSYLVAILVAQPSWTSQDSWQLRQHTRGDVRVVYSIAKQHKPRAVKKVRLRKM